MFHVFNLGGVSALRQAVDCEQYKIVGELIKLGADTSNLSLAAGDTPIHAIMIMVLEKDKSKWEAPCENMSLQWTAKFLNRTIGYVKNLALVMDLDCSC